MRILDYFRSLVKSKVPTYRLCILGLDNSGKTTIVKALTGDDITEILPTRGFYIKSLVHQTSGVVFNICDVGGQKSLRPYWRNYFQQVHAIMYVIDSSDRRRLEETGIELQQLLDDDKLTGLPLLIFANKQDLIHALTTTELSSGLNLHSIRDRHWQIVACSAKTMEGLQDGIDFLVSQINESG